MNMDKIKDNIIVAEDITKSFVGKKALDSFSVSIPRGSVFGLLGPNGAGKTTFIRILNQILAADSGNLFFNGEKINPSHISLIGYLPEERGLYKSMKIGEHALYLAQLKGLTKVEAKKRLNKWFDKFEIADWWNKKVEELSKGMQQKVQFITTVLHEPELLIFDEPFSGFDPINTDAVKQEILALRDNGATIIFSTHNMASVEEICDEIVLINKSVKLLEGSVKDVKKSFKTGVYEILFSGYYDKFLTTLTSDYTIIEQKIEKDISSIRIKMLNDVPTNALIKHLMSSGNIISFREIYPTMNEVFIKAVQNSEAKQEVF